MKDNSFEVILQKRQIKLNMKRRFLQKQIETNPNEDNILPILLRIRSVDVERYNITKRLEAGR